MKREYDVLVVGGGPGGAYAAKTFAEKGYSVLLTEKRPAIGVPVRCAEGVGKKLLHEFFKPEDQWIAAEIEKANIIAPDGFKMELEPERAGSEVGYVLHRKIFDRDLVWQAAGAGAEVQVKTRAVSPLMENGAVKGAILEQNGTSHEVRARLTIAADGVESKFSRWCGVDTTVPLREMETCAQYLMTGIDIDPHATEFFVGNDVAPGGYVWIFPKGEKTANVGIGVGGDRCKPGNRPIDYLNRFVKSHFPNGKTIELIAGGVSICQPLPCTVADNLMIVGDAARVSDPLTGGGIYAALYTGKLAGEVGAKGLDQGDTSSQKLMPYDKTWRESYLGKALERNYQIKEVFVKLIDDDLNAIIHSVAKMNMSDFNTLNLIKNIIAANPKVALKLGKAGLKNLIDSF
ncbi:MAG: NAD(P)/FAD-dependent oxidoreductase [Methanomicrobiales archaeon]|nr:NAD(P)/FAD-dependent oxidoreductase [Methanomicrobiales archaeon]